MARNLCNTYRHDDSSKEKTTFLIFFVFILLWNQTVFEDQTVFDFLWLISFKTKEDEINIKTNSLSVDRWSAIVIRVALFVVCTSENGFDSIIWNGACDRHFWVKHDVLHIFTFTIFS